MSSSADLIRRRDAVVPRGVTRLNELTVARAEGAWLVDADGRRVLDLATGIAVMSVGHSQPEIVSAAQAQAARLQHTCIHVATYEPYVALCEKLAALFPHGERTKVMLANSGAEAIENAVKIARQATRRTALIAFTEGFHGRTLLAATLTSKVALKRGTGPFAPEVHRLPFPNGFRRGAGLSEARFVEQELARLRECFGNVVRAEDVAAIVIEPVQGEGGFVPCPSAYLRGLAELARAHGILLIADEVQTGFGRTGRLAAYEHAGITPDLSTWAKAMGGGFPVSAVIGRAELMDAAEVGTLGGTYGGNPVACAAALAAIDFIEQRDLCARAVTLGERIERRLNALKERCPAVADVRGLGAMRALELCEAGDPERPLGALAAETVRRCLGEGVAMLTAGVYGNVIRLLPPLVIDDADLDRGLDVLERSLLSAASAHAAARR
jgi:4-aminobutyrate aminotransferase / (S)-3-amino-2-methylpropionate transaminase / 5-aminovalerate transaminase